MPLKPGKSKKIMEANMREMMASGYPHKQAVAAALQKAYGRKKSKKSRRN